MFAQSNSRFNALELERARLDDERERAVHALIQRYQPEVLERILRALDDRETTLVNLAPLTAALAFRDAVLEQARTRPLTAEDVRQLAATAAGEIPVTTSAPQPVFDRAIFVFGLRRGANHAITEWLRGHFDDAEVRYLNSAEIALFETDGDLLTIDRDKYARMRLNPAERILLVGYENLDPVVFPLDHNAQMARRSDVVVVLRDYPNMAASIARQAREDPAFAYRYHIRDLLGLWKRYARYLENHSFGYTYISFNAWFSDPLVRHQVSRALGLRHSDSGLNNVSPYGQGSSFDGLRHDGRAQEMTVLNRWESMFDDSLFQFLLLADEEALEVSQRLFGGFPYDRGELLARWRAGGSGK